jgi:serine phosphatase RsbU (regulator of sigma subunit)
MEWQRHFERHATPQMGRTCVFEVVIWTDGLTENHNGDLEQFGDWRSMGAVLSCVEKAAGEAFAQAVAEARSWGEGHSSDDCTVLGLERMALPKPVA